MDALLSALAGAGGALVGVLWSGLVSAPWLARITRRDATAAPPGADGGLQALAIVILVSSGAAQGLLFWLGWGLVAIFGWPWPAIGLAFGLLCWLALAAPVIASLALQSARGRRVAIVQAVEWLAICVSVGLFCAFGGQRLV